MSEALTYSIFTGALLGLAFIWSIVPVILLVISSRLYKANRKLDAIREELELLRLPSRPR